MAAPIRRLRADGAAPPSLTHTRAKGIFASERQMEWHRLSKKPRSLVFGAFPITKDLHLEVGSTTRLVAAHTSPPVPKTEWKEAISTSPCPSTVLGHSTPLAGSDRTLKLEAYSGKMRYREGKSNSDSSYDIVPVPAPLRRPPRAPTTVQILPDDFDAVTHDYETAVATEIFPYDGVTEVKSIKSPEDQDGEDEPRYSRVYGEWAERHEVHRRQAAMPADFGKYMEEVTRRLQEVGVDEQGNLLDTTIRARGVVAARQYQPPREVKREGKVNMWREEVARNESEFGGSVAGTNDTVRRSHERTYTVDQGTVKPREVEATLRRSQSGISQSCRSERVYTPMELNTPCALKPQKIAGTIVKREKRARDPSPTRSERIYTLAEINALTGQSIKYSPPRKSGFTGQELHHSRSTNSSSPLQNLKIKHSISSPAPVRSRSSSTSSIQGVLGSCQPSLVHLAPVLSSLGIRRQEHLRALAKLREETRDREMKEEMLKQGVTLLEWAILVDKLQEF